MLTRSVGVVELSRRMGNQQKLMEKQRRDFELAVFAGNGKTV
jgi:hypothetical protein